MRTRTWMRANVAAVALAVVASALPAGAQERRPFETAAQEFDQRLERSVFELNAERQRLAAEKLPLSRRLSELETELLEVRAQYQDAARMLEGRQLDLSNLTAEIRSRREELDYLTNLFSEYARNFHSRLHVAELQRYEALVERARLARDAADGSDEHVFAAQLALVEESLARLASAGGGSRFNGRAVDGQGNVHPGSFLVLGPIGLFRSANGEVVGTVEQRIGSLEPTIVPFASPELAATAARTIAMGYGDIPVDPTLGNAHKIEATKETLVEHVKKGGPVMIPILALAAAALLVAMGKWIHLTLVRKPSRRSLEPVFDALSRGDVAAATLAASKVRGPAGEMLRQGVEHAREPRELIEEVMYETVLATKLRLGRLLPFVAIAAASAPLLGLLGTVTGIINTFKMLTVYGSGDVKSLSGGISEALITTEFGLIVAIPSLLLHAFLSRKATGIVANMEQVAVRFANAAARGGKAERGPRAKDEAEVVHRERAGLVAAH